MTDTDDKQTLIDTDGLNPADPIGSRLHEKNLHDVLGDHNLLADDHGVTEYYPSLANSGDHVVSIAIPIWLNTVLDVLCDREEKEYADLVRHAIVHGCAIYDHKIGALIDEAYQKHSDAIIHGDEDDTDAFDDVCKITMECSRHSIRLSGSLFNTVSRFRRRSGMCQEKFYGLLILYSLHTHPLMASRHDKIGGVLSQAERKLHRRLKNIS